MERLITLSRPAVLDESEAGQPDGPFCAHCSFCHHSLCPSGPRKIQGNTQPAGQAEQFFVGNHFRHRHHEVILFHVFDQAEIELPFRDTVRLVDMETGERIEIH